MDDSTFASRQSSLRAFIWYIQYISVSPKMSLTPFWFSPLDINCLEMLVVFLALKTFLPVLKRHHVMVRSDSMTVVAYINHQGGLRSHTLCRMARRLPLLSTERTPLVKGSSCVGQIEPWRGHAVQRQGSPGWMGATPSNGSRDLVSHREGRGWPLCLRKQVKIIIFLSFCSKQAK